MNRSGLPIAIATGAFMWAAACSTPSDGTFIPEDAGPDSAVLPKPDVAQIPEDTGPARCASDEDCQKSPFGKLCNTANGECVECSVDDDKCPLGQYCEPTKRKCTFGCRDNRDCSAIADAGTDAMGDAGPLLNCDLASRYCVGCLTDADCPMGTLCNSISKACVPGCKPGRGCGPGYECCGTECFDTMRETEHCGACGQRCDTVASVGRACANGACTYLACKQGFGDCLTAAPNLDGCETPIDTASNCGACGRACDTTHSEGATCSGSTCRYSGCKAGFEDCNKRAPNIEGCETPVDTTTNCGGCGIACDTSTANTATCELFVVTPPALDAGEDASSEAGADSAAESGVDGGAEAGGTSQVAYRCAYGQCKAGLGDCDQSVPNTNGCETPLSTSSNCGACGAACGATNVLTSSCLNSTCSYTCLDGWGNCSPTGQNRSGCETNLKTTANCGGCGNACDTTHSTGASCIGAACAYSSCALGWGDCDTQPPNTNGCETPLTTTSNCGTCGQTCSADEGCCGGGCTPLTSNTNCGACGKTCSTGEACCGQGCAALWQEGNCGGCGVTCSAGRTCLERSCKTSLASSSASSGTCAMPKIITGNGTYTGTTASSLVVANVSCAGTQSNSKGQVYAFTSTKNGTVTINACASSYDTYLYVGTGCTDGLIYNVACNDDSSSCGTNTRSRVSFPVAEGVTYYAVISGSGSSSTGVYSFTVSGF